MGNLLLENPNGLIKKMTPDELYQKLKPQEGKLNVDVVFINMKNGSKIAEVFKRLKVSQIFTYEYSGSNMTQSEKLGPDASTNYYEFMHIVTLEIITKLIR